MDFLITKEDRETLIDAVERLKELCWRYSYPLDVAEKCEKILCVQKPESEEQDKLNLG